MEVIPAMVEAVRRDGDNYLGAADAVLPPHLPGVHWTYWHRLWLAACQRADAKDRQIARSLYIAAKYNARNARDAFAWANVWDGMDPDSHIRRSWLRRASVFTGLLAQNTPRA